MDPLTAVIIYLVSTAATAVAAYEIGSGEYTRASMVALLCALCSVVYLVVSILKV